MIKLTAVTSFHCVEAIVDVGQGVGVCDKLIHLELAPGHGKY